jgi:NAD(P)-dependent dehydrogenase (short-subunit alcohol dehydrogenase family)
MRMTGRVAVVTGASSGIGAAVARRLAAAGARVGLIALPDPALAGEAEAIRERGGTAAAAAADVTDRAAVHDALDRLTRDLGPVDLLVLNAGIGMATRIDDPFSAEAVERLVRVNLLGPVYAIEAALPQMLERRRGHLVGVSSLSSYRGQPIFSGYCASKGGLATLLEGLRIELREYGIAVTTVRPGFVRTPMTAEARAPRFMLEADEAARIIMKGIAARRAEIDFPWQPALIAGLVRWLPSALYDRLAAATILAKYRSRRDE